MRIALFLEDAGQLAFLRRIVERVLEDEEIAATIIERNRAGGSGATMTSLRGYLRDVGRTEEFAEIMIVSIDGNCVGWREKLREIRAVVDAAGYAGRVVCAIPDPHIEVWYLADGRAVRDVAGANRQNALPPYKCDRGRYKQLLREVFLSAGVDPPSGGTEYGAEVAERLDLTAARRSQESLEFFLDELHGAVRVGAL